MTHETRLDNIRFNSKSKQKTDLILSTEQILHFTSTATVRTYIFEHKGIYSQAPTVYPCIHYFSVPSLGDELSHSNIILYAAEGWSACRLEVDVIDKLFSRVCCTSRHRDGWEISMRK